MDFDFLTLGRDLGHCYGLDRSSLSPSGARLRLPVWLSSGYSTPSCSCSANAKRNPENMKMRTSLRNHRVLWAVLSTTIALGVVAVGSYFGFVVQNNDSDLVKLPNYAIGATKLMWTQGYIGQPDDFSSQLDRSDLVIEGVIDELYLARWSSVDGAAPDILPSYDWDKLVIDLARRSSVDGAAPNTLPPYDWSKLATNHSAIHIRTPVQLLVKQIFKGKSIGDTLKFSFMGGRVGDTAHIVDWNESFQEGARIIVFLATGAPGSPVRNVEASGFYPRMHLVVEGDVAQGPVKDIPIKELLRQLQ